MESLTVTRAESEGREADGVYGQEVSMRLAYKAVDSPVGRLKLVAHDHGLVALLWETEIAGRVPQGELTESADHPVLQQTETELAEYFAGGRTAFSVPLDARGTAFQKRVWEALRAIPFGETRTYGQLARQIGDPAATRAVGAANGRNPVAILVPCHRVVGAAGKLTGFAGGLAAKDHLLRLESRSERLF